jgi:hypothetical protein
MAWCRRRQAAPTAIAEAASAVRIGLRQENRAAKARRRAVSDGCRGVCEFEGRQPYAPGGAATTGIAASPLGRRAMPARLH